MGYIKRKKQAGFSMIEAVIAIFIVGTSFVVFLTVLASTIQFQSKESDYIIAANLAQEGVELVRNLRDNNWKNGCKAFDTSSIPCTTGTGMFLGTGNYCVNYNDTVLPVSGECDVKINGLDEDSKFIRVVDISGSGESRTIKSTVTWEERGGGGERTSEVTDTLWAWGNNEN